jgi:hypothetical protein
MELMTNIFMFLMGLNMLLERSNTAKRRMYILKGDSINCLLAKAFKIPRKMIVPMPSHIKYSLGWAITPPAFGIKICIMKRKITERIINK